MIEIGVRNTDDRGSDDVGTELPDQIRIDRHALDDDGVHAVRDLRLFFSQSWVLVLGLVMFGAAGVGLFATTFPRGERALLRVAILVGVMIVIGGVIGPLVTRALNRR